ncbi:MAG: hypothetical protein JO253_03625 [Alphaproteobacteria bacterium]|nr:hypothetical protein [Alphaproteobacteria bacterium]
MIVAEINASQVEALKARMQMLRGKLQDRIAVQVEKESINLMRYVVTQKLRGQVLGVKSGRLWRSITYRIDKDGAKTVGIVGTNVFYGRLWELGFSRAQGTGSRGGLGSKQGSRGGQPRTITARMQAYYDSKHPAKTTTYAARPFLRPSLEENRDKILSNIRRAITATIKESA